MLDTYTHYAVMGPWDCFLKVPLIADLDPLGSLSKGKDVAGGVMPFARTPLPRAAPSGGRAGGRALNL